jgi:hypothetical protein
MSESDEFDTLMSDVEDATGGDLVKRLRAALKAQKTELTGLRTQVQEQTKVSRAAALKTALEASGAKPALAKYFPSDGDVTNEAVLAWLKEDGELFGWTAPEATEPVTTDDVAAATAISSLKPRQGPDTHGRVAALGATPTLGRNIAPGSAQEARALADELLSQLNPTL